MKQPETNEFYNSLIMEKDALSRNPVVQKYLAVCNAITVYGNPENFTKMVTPQIFLKPQKDPETTIKTAILMYMHEVKPAKYGELYRHLRFKHGYNVSYTYLKIILKHMPEVDNLGRGQGWILKEK